MFQMIIKYQKLNFTLRARDRIFLPPYKGSTFRGGFGNAFKRVVCIFRNKDCRDCPIVRECSYAYIFETPAPEGSAFFNMDKYETIPHPFVIEPPEETRQLYEPGSEISFVLILIGKAIDYLPYFIMAFEYLGELGIGQGRGKYELVKVEIMREPVYDGKTRILKPPAYKMIEIPENDFPDQSWALGGEESGCRDEEELQLELKTPVRIKYRREFATKLEFHILITNLMRRLALLNFYHGENKEPEWGHKKLIEIARTVRLEKNEAKWSDWERYSHRQKVRMKLGGLVGRVVYRGQISGFMPMLRAGEIFHLGKGTSFGLGKYQIIDLKNEGERHRYG